MDSDWKTAHPINFRTHIKFSTFFIVCCTFTLCASSQDERASLPISTANSVKQLSAAEAQQRLPITLKGVVTAVPEGWKGFFLEDETGGVYCEPLNTDAEFAFWPVKAGEKVELHGVTAPGHRNSFVAVTEIASRTNGSLPKPPLRTLESVIDDRLDADFVRLQGHIVGLINIAGEMEYGLLSNGIEAQVIHAGFRVDPKVYEHSEVEICGVVIPQEGNIRPIKIVVPNAQSFTMRATHIEVLDSTVRSTIETVLRQAVMDTPVVRISGDIYSHEAEDIWLVENGFGINWEAGGVLLPKNTKHVELIGIIHGDVKQRSIKYATILSTDDAPVGHDYAQIITQENIGSYLNQIVTINATFWDSNSFESETVLSFDLGNSKLTCRVPELAINDALPDLQRGAVYSLTGLLTPDFQHARAPTLILHSSNDIKLVTRPPWSVRFTLYVVSLLSAGLAIGLATTIYGWQQTITARRRVESAQAELRVANETLEARVVDRTMELDSINRRLTDEAVARLLVERDLKQTLASLEDAQTLAQIGSFVWNAESNTSAWSKQCYLVHGLEIHESPPQLDEYCLKVIEEDRSAFRSFLRKAATSLEREEFRYRIMLPAGETRWVRSLIKSIRSTNGSLLSLEGIVQNVTEQVSAEEQLRHSVKMEVAGHFAGGIAHDLNNTLSIVKLNCFLLSSNLQPSLASDFALYIDAIEAAADRSAMLTKQLLTFSRKQIIRPVLLNVNATIQSFSPLVSKLLEDRITIQFDLAEKSQMYV